MHGKLGRGDIGVLGFWLNQPGRTLAASPGRWGEAQGTRLEVEGAPPKHDSRHGGQGREDHGSPKAEAHAKSSEEPGQSSLKEAISASLKGFWRYCSGCLEKGYMGVPCAISYTYLRI